MCDDVVRDRFFCFKHLHLARNNDRLKDMKRVLTSIKRLIHNERQEEMTTHNWQQLCLTKVVTGFL